MTSHDVRDMLDLPSAAGPRPAKKQKLGLPKGAGLKGLAREVMGLGGDNPIAIVPEVPLFKKRRLANRKPASRWDLKPFKNSARGDDLVLKHWRRKIDKPLGGVEDAEAAAAEAMTGEEIDDSTFAKFNVHVTLPQYDDMQYTANLQNDDWDKAETDYLMGLAQEFDLRWPLIWDRYEWQLHMPRQPAEGEVWVAAPESQPRTMEDLKARYYQISAKMKEVHVPVPDMSQAEYSLYQLMNSYDPTQERARKQFAEATMARSPEDRKEEENLLIELKRIMARSDRLNEEKKELYARLEAPVSSGTIAPYTTSAGLQALLQQLVSANKSKQRRSLIAPEGVSPVPGLGGQQSMGQDRRENGNRESLSGPSNRKGPGPTERRKLTEEEERTYGVSHPTERLTSGPAFRYEKTQRWFSGKTVSLQQKLSAVLTHLDLPEKRLVMPTSRVVAQYEKLLHSIITLLELRKVADKLDDNIKVESAKKLDKEKKERRERGEPEAEVDGQDGDNDADMADAGADGDGDAGANGSNYEEPVGDDGEEVVKRESREESARASAAPSARATSMHKRSASVMSQVSDKSTKRQKK